MHDLRQKAASEHTDARRDRTRQKLEPAVLELASERDITTTSVAELARRAGIYRSTFYAHASSPMELLTKVLSAELDEVRAVLLKALERDGSLYRELTRQTMGQVIDHVLRHKAVYGSVNRASSIYAMRVVLAEHIQSCLVLLFQNGYVRPPSSHPENLELYSSYLAHGSAAAVETWLRQPEPHDRELVLSAIEAMLPPWYAPA